MSRQRIQVPSGQVCARLLVEDYEYNAEQLLYSLEAAMGGAAFRDNLEYIMRVEDWRHRLDDEGNLIEHKGDE